jgi:hypothetical protein
MSGRAAVLVQLSARVLIMTRRERQKNASGKVGKLNGISCCLERVVAAESVTAKTQLRGRRGGLG